MSTQEPVAPVDGIPPYRARPRRGGPSPSAVVLSLVAAALAGLIVGGGIALFGDRDEGARGTSSPTGQATATSVEIEPASIASFDPVGGSGFRDQGDGTWTTQTYTTAEFGALKSGVGLLVDLGEAREVSTVTLPSATAGLAVQLLAGDEAPSGDPEGMTEADATTTAEGETVLVADGAGAHRYWLVWVSALAETGGGYSATVTTPVVEGPEA